MSQSLIKVLIDTGELDDELARQLTSLLKAPQLNNDAILQVITATDLAQTTSRLLGIPLVNLQEYDFNSLCHHLGLSSLIQKYCAIPIGHSDQTLTLATSDPTNSEIENEFRFATGLNIELVIADINSIKKAIHSLYGRNIPSGGSSKKEINALDLARMVDLSDEELGNIEDLSQDDAPVSRYIHQVLLEAVRKGASDIHFEPYEDSYRIRLRCDGILLETHQPAVQLGRRLSTRVKILSNLDIAERRLPQDGRSKLKLNSELSVDMRVSTLPTLWGEKVVLRLLESSATQLDINKLGYNEQQKQIYLNALKKPQGLILMTGPTGSGKTISLYSGLAILNTTQVNIATAEDPVEINLPGINQVQVQPHIGFDFAAALRSFLRQDPDIVMVGEIRDLETAEIAIKASQTGHLVLSTLHTNSAAETLVRLQNMGIQPYNIASSLSLVIAQRLVRLLCPNCKQRYHISAEQSQQLNLPSSQTLFQANRHGCENCNSGYSGRVGLFEMMENTSDLNQAILTSADARTIEAIAVKQGMTTLRMSGIEKLAQGLTSFEELQRILYFS
ncbi:type IV-A pilus assembly ATPase PilB [Vibrio sp. 404]|uniref:Type IV-A pilus assembly ATPase PilB n=1 Tax=Vibrio marinisediminis TaxID=2758441 RepID=A0A7W2FU35_9VIBR|nr:type IV-A pilus assembly ATPase PilB [Vibrio marinisediminis]MBA5764252.1 type IV-A pilus assembly ATPase PilB [Vibrio marinisediminis]